MSIPTFSWSSFLRSRCLICMQYLFLPQAQVNQTPPPLFCKLWNTIYRGIINIRTIMMKTINKRLNLYTKNILIGWGSCIFLEFRFFFPQTNLLSSYCGGWLQFHQHLSFWNFFGQKSFAHNRFDQINNGRKLIWHQLVIL